MFKLKRNTLYIEDGETEIFMNSFFQYLNEDIKNF